MKRWSGFMVLIMGLLIVLGCLAGKEGAASATAAATVTVTTTNNLELAAGVGYTLSFTPSTPLDMNNRIVLGAPFGDLSAGDLNGVTISDGTTTVHPTSIGMDGFYYIELGTVDPSTPLSGLVTITFPPSFGITNPTAGSYTISLATDADMNQFANANLDIESTVLQSLTIDQGTLVPNPDTPAEYTTVLSSVYSSVSLHVVPLDPLAQVSVTVGPSAQASVTDVTYATYLGGNYSIDPQANSSIHVTVTTPDNLTAVYTIGITRQYDIPYVNVLDSNDDGSTFSGTLHWSGAGFGIPAGSTYEVALMDDNGTVKTSLPGPIAYNSDPNTWNYEYKVPSTPLAGATRIEVVLKDANGTVLATKSVPLWLNNDLFAPIRFTDSDPHGGSIVGSLNWTRGMDDSQIDHYNIYYMTKTDTNLQLLDSVAKNTYGTYNYSISPTAAPGATKFMIGFVNSNDEVAPIYPTVYVYDDQTQDAVQSVPSNAAWSAPTQLNVITYSTTATSTSGSIIWQVPTKADGSVDNTIQAFNLYFTDKNGAKIAPIASLPYIDSLQSMYFNPHGLSIPSGAVHIAVFTVGQDGAESTSYASGPIGLMDLNGNGATDLSDLVMGLGSSYNLSQVTLKSLLHQLVSPYSATTS